jgi:glucokinase
MQEQGDLAMGFDLGGSFLKAGLVDGAGRLLSFVREPVKGGNGAEVLAQVVELAARIHEHPMPVGVAVPGALAPDGRTIVSAPSYPEWQGMDVVEALERAGLPGVVVGNDANLAACGEAWQGAGRQGESLALFTLGTGVGGGLVLAGRLWTGPLGTAGEFGHLPLVRDGHLCGCGARGCLETLASATALLARARQLADQGQAPLLAQHLRDWSQLDGENLAQLARAGDPGCRQAFVELGQALGRAVAMVHNVLALPLYLVGGGLCPAFDLFGPALLIEFSASAFPHLATRHKDRVAESGEAGPHQTGPRILPAQLGNRAGVIGAARWAREMGNREKDEGIWSSRQR